MKKVRKQSMQLYEEITPQVEGSSGMVMSLMVKHQGDRVDQSKRGKVVGDDVTETTRMKGHIGC